MNSHQRVAADCGAMVAAGLLDHTVAVGQVYASAGGALTLTEAAGVVDEWTHRTRRASPRYHDGRTLRFSRLDIPTAS